MREWKIVLVQIMIVVIAAHMALTMIGPLNFAPSPRLEASLSQTGERLILLLRADANVLRTSVALARLLEAILVLASVTMLGRLFVTFRTGDNRYAAA